MTGPRVENDGWVTDTRTVRGTPLDVPPVYTPKGKRPIDPDHIRVEYGYNRTAEEWTAWVVVVGRLTESKSTSRFDDIVTRNMGREGDRPWPAWMVEFVDKHRPRGGAW